MTTDKDDLEPLEPSTAQQLSLDHKETSCAEATVQNYHYRTNAFVEWCETEGIDNLNDVSGRDIQQYRLWRKDDGDLNKVTLRMQMSTIRVFLKWAGRIEAVPENLYDKVMVPRVRPEERQRDETLDAETAQEILDHLDTSMRLLSTHCSAFCGRREYESEPPSRWMSVVSTSTTVTSSLNTGPKKGLHSKMTKVGNV